MTPVPVPSPLRTFGAYAVKDGSTTQVVVNMACIEAHIATGGRRLQEEESEAATDAKAAVTDDTGGGGIAARGGSGDGGPLQAGLVAVVSISTLAALSGGDRRGKMNAGGENASEDIDTLPQRQKQTSADTSPPATSATAAASKAHSLHAPMATGTPKQVAATHHTTTTTADGDSGGYLGRVDDVTLAITPPTTPAFQLPSHCPHPCAGHKRAFVDS